MKSDSRIPRIAPFAALAVFIHAGTALSQTYSVADMGTLGGPLSTGQAINGAGIAVGYAARADADFHAIIPGVLPGEIAPRSDDRQSHAFAINDLGQVAVISYDLGEIVPHGILWQNGVATDLGDFAPRGINGSCVLAGGHTTLTGGAGWFEHAAIWRGGVMTELPALGGDGGCAAAVNDAGVAVGWSWTTHNATVRATLWLNGLAHDLGSLAGTPAARSQAYAINGSGQVVGWSTSAAGAPHAFVFGVNGTGAVTSRQDLGVLSATGARASYAFAINSAGDVVGSSGSRAFLWRGGVMTDLNTLISPDSGWVLERATGINAAGQIVGGGKLNGLPHGFVLTPVTGCAADFNGDGVLNADDLGDFITGYFNTPSDPRCDFNADGAINADDLGDFITAYFNGC